MKEKGWVDPFCRNFRHMHISFILPAFNEEAYLKKSLSALHQAISANEEEGLSWEIIVCDNNSTDKTARIAEEMGAKVVFEPVNQISRARNSGAQSAAGDWFVFMDADAFLSPELLAEAIAVIRNDDLIGFGATVAITDGSLFNKLRMERLNPLFRAFNVCGGVFLACRASAFKSIGGFSNDLYAYEEFDFIARLKRYGKTQSKRFTVLHQNPIQTSGRKGEGSIRNLLSLFFSNMFALFLFLLRPFLPSTLLKKMGRRLLGYWYEGRR